MYHRTTPNTHEEQGSQRTEDAAYQNHNNDANNDADRCTAAVVVATSCTDLWGGST